MLEREDIIRMAREANILELMGYDNPHMKQWNADVVRELELFAQLVAAAEREHYDDLFANIKNWCEAYPISVFPEPDFKKAHEVLKANGMTLDAISASNMKHVITQVQNMIDAAIRARGQQ